MRTVILTTALLLSVMTFGQNPIGLETVKKINMFSNINPMEWIKIKNNQYIIYTGSTFNHELFTEAERILKLNGLDIFNPDIDRSVNDLNVTSLNLIYESTSPLGNIAKIDMEWITELYVYKLNINGSMSEFRVVKID